LIYLSFSWGQPQVTLHWPLDQREGCQLVWDGEKRSLTSEARFSFPGTMGKHRLQLSRAGYHPLTLEVELGWGDDQALTPEWDPLPATVRRGQYERLRAQLATAASRPANDPKLAAARQAGEKFLRDWPQATERFSVRAGLAALPGAFDALTPGKADPTQFGWPAGTPVLAALAPAQDLAAGARITSLAWDRDGQRLTWATSSATVGLWEPLTGRGSLLRDLRKEYPEARDALLAPGGETLALALQDGTLVVWDVLQDRERGRLAKAVALAAPPALRLAATFRQGERGYAGVVDTAVNAHKARSPLHDSASLPLDQASGGHAESHVLLRFDDLFGTGPGQVPPGAKLEAARLRLFVTNPGGTVRFHRLVRAWPADTTWADWSASGGAGLQADGQEARADADAELLEPQDGFVTVDVLSSLQAWAQKEPNHGWALLPTNTDGVTFTSSENYDPERRPTLSVVWSRPSADPQPAVAKQAEVAEQRACWACSGDGQALVAVAPGNSGKGLLTFISLKSAQLLLDHETDSQDIVSLGLGETAQRVAWVSDGEPRAGDGLGRLTLWLTAGQRDSDPLRAGLRQGIAKVGWAARRPELATCGRDGQLSLWSEHWSGNFTPEPLSFPQPIADCWLSPDGQRLLAQTVAGALRIWQRDETGAWQTQGGLDSNDDGARPLCVAFTPDGRSVILARSSAGLALLPARGWSLP